MANEVRNTRVHVKLHPLVAFNIADHYTRRNRLSDSEEGSASEHVIGALFGIQKGLDVTIFDSFELKYTKHSEEGVQIDIEFLNERNRQFSQVFPEFEVLGWYCVGATDPRNNICIHKSMMDYNKNPLFLHMDPNLRISDTKKIPPITFYESETHIIEGLPRIIFVQVPYKVKTSETEGIAMDQIAKATPAIEDNRSTLHSHLGNVRDAIMVLSRQLEKLVAYIEDGQNGSRPMDYSIIHRLSTLCNYLPTIRAVDVQNGFWENHMDAVLVNYLASLTKGVHSAKITAERFSSIVKRDSN